MSNIKPEMSRALIKMVGVAKKDYSRFWTSGGRGRSEYAQAQIDGFMESFEFKGGSKYIKVIHENSVWGFIVNTESDSKFKYGDILKAAGWAAPARNKARGNIFEDLSWVQWTGPAYL